MTLQAMHEIHKLRSQIARIVQANFPTVNVGLDDKLKPPSDTQVRRSASRSRRES